MTTKRGRRQNVNGLTPYFFSFFQPTAGEQNPKMANILNFGVFLALVSSSFCIHSRNKIYRWTKSVESYQSKGKWLSDHWFFKTSTTMASQCAYRCLKTPICQSFNYDGADGQCELNKNTHLEYPDDFIDAVEEREYHSRDSFSINPVSSCTVYSFKSSSIDKWFLFLALESTFSAS